MEPEKPLRIDQVASVTGLTKRTIRYYEEIGLLPAAERSGGNYRLYHPSDISRLQSLTRLKENLGLPLEVMKRFMALEEDLGEVRQQFHQADGLEGKLAAIDEGDKLLEELLALIDDRLARLQTERTALVDRIARNRLRRQTWTQEPPQPSDT